MRKEENINRIISEAIVNDVYLKNLNNEKSKLYTLFSSPFIIENTSKFYFENKGVNVRIKMNNNSELMIEKINLLIDNRIKQIIHAYENDSRTYLR